MIASFCTAIILTKNIGTLQMFSSSFDLIFFFYFLLHNINFNYLKTRSHSFPSNFYEKRLFFYMTFEGNLGDILQT